MSITVVIIVILAAIALALIVFRTAHGSATKIATVDDLEGCTEPIDLPAFLNLLDPAEEEFLRANLSPQVFRRIQRQRLLAAAEYVRCRSEEHTSELQSLAYLVCRLLLEKKKNLNTRDYTGFTRSS